MPERNGYPDGAPCWADATCPDSRAGAKFYGAVFGWEFEDMGEQFGHYMMARKDGKLVAAVGEPMPGDSAPAAWCVYLMTSDAEATAKMIEASGGTVVVAPMEIPGEGHMLIGADPDGATFGAWQPIEHKGAQLYGEPGSMAWAEVVTADPKTADAFYGTVFPIEQEQMGESDGEFDYMLWKVDGDPVAGRYATGATTPAMPPHWMTFFAVDNTDDTVATARRLGGAVLAPAKDSEHGRFAILADPYGAQFAVIQTA